MADVTEIQAGIANSLFQLQELNQRIQTLAQLGRGLGPAIGKEAIGGLGGILAQEIFGSARTGSVSYNLTKKLVASGRPNNLRLKRREWSTSSTKSSKELFHCSLKSL